MLHPATLLFGDYGDTRGRAWGLWAAVNGWLDGDINPLLGAPHGLASSEIVTQPLWQWPSLWLTRAFGEIAAINVLAMASFASSAMSAFLVFHAVLRSTSAAVVGGYVFGFGPAAVMQAVGGHGEYAFCIFLPPFLLALWCNYARRTWRSALLVAAAYAGITLTSLYIGYFAALLGLFIATVDLAIARRAGRLAIAGNYLLCAVFAAALLLPFEWRAIHEQLTAPREVLLAAGHARDFGNLYVYAARWWEYLVPSIDHPFLGPRVLPFVHAHLHYSNVFEQTLYLGLVPLSLMLAGGILAALGPFASGRRALFVLLASASAWMFFVSMPPRLLDTVPTVSYFAYGFAPMFRVYARAGIVVQMLVACAAAVVLAELASRMPPRRYRACVAILACALALEYWSVPALSRVSEPPPVYAWLAKQPGDAIVAEYPMMPADDAAFYTYAFWQRVHAKRLVNGGLPAHPAAWRTYEQVRDLGDPATPARLAAAGVRFAIVHDAMYAEGPIPAPLKRYYPPKRAAQPYGAGRAPEVPAGLRLVADFGGDRVYAVEPR